MCFPLGPTRHLIHTPMARYSLFVLKVPLNTNQPTVTQWHDTKNTVDVVLLG